MNTPVAPLRACASCRPAALFLLTLIAGLPSLRAVDRIFVLGDAGRIQQFEADSKGAIKPVATYTAKELPAAFPAGAIEVKSGNILQVYDEQGQPKARFLIDAKAKTLRLYDGKAGEV